MTPCEKRVTLRAGDYIAIADLAEEDYHNVARAFMAAGCDENEYDKINVMPEDWVFFGWEEHQGLTHWDFHKSFKGSPRQLTLTQILNATNAGLEEKEMGSEQWVPEVGDSVRTRDKISPREHVVIAIDGDMAWIKLAYQKQRGQLYPLEQLTPWQTEEDLAVEEMLAQVRYQNNGLNGSELAKIVCQAAIKAGYRKQPQPVEDIDFDDPDNWRAGDVVECVDSHTGFTTGRFYELANWGSGRVLDMDGDCITVKEDDAGDDYYAPVEKFRFVGRP